MTPTTISERRCAVQRRWLDAAHRPRRAHDQRRRSIARSISAATRASDRRVADRGRGSAAARAAGRARRHLRSTRSSIAASLPGDGCRRVRRRAHAASGTGSRSCSRGRGGRAADRRRGRRAGRALPAHRDPPLDRAVHVARPGPRRPAVVARRRRPLGRHRRQHAARGATCAGSSRCRFPVAVYRMRGAGG